MECRGIRGRPCARRANGLALVAAVLLMVTHVAVAAEPSAGAIEETTAAVAPLTRFTLPPLQPRRPPQNLANRTLVLSDVGDELELAYGFSRSRFRQVVELAPFPALVQEATRRAEDWSLSWRHRLGRDWDASVRLPFSSTREAQPSRVPASAARQEDVQELVFDASGIGDVELRLSRELCGRTAPLQGLALDLGVKLATGDSGFDAGTALLSPGTGQRDLSFGLRAKRELSGWSGSAGVARVLRLQGERVASDGTRLQIDPGDLWRASVRADRALRSWLVGSLELSGFTGGRAVTNGAPVPASVSELLTLEPSMTVSIADDFEAVIYGRFPLAQNGEPSDGAYGFAARRRL